MSRVAPVVETEIREIAPTGFARMFGALANNVYYRTYWLGNQVGTLTMQMQMVANGYLAYTLTGSAEALGFVSLASGIPMLCFAPFGGVFADRYEKRTLLMIVQSILCLLALTVGVSLVLGILTYWQLVGTSLCQGMCFAVMMPARQSWIPNLVTSEDLPNAIALNNAGMNASRIMGPSIAGILIALPVVGPRGIYFLQLVALTGVMYSLLKIPAGLRGESRNRGNMLEEVTAGMRYIIRSETLAPLFILALFTFLLGQSYQMLLPAFALNTLNVGAEGLGFMMTAVGAGALTGSLSMAYFSGSKRKGRIQAIAGTTLGVALFSFGVFSGLGIFPLVLVALFVVGMSADFYMTINNTLIMLNTDRALFGRVMAVTMMTFALAPLSSAPFGAMIDLIGGPLTMMLIGGTLALFVVGMALFHPGYRKLT